MSNYVFVDANGVTRYAKSTGAGTDGDPFVQSVAFDAALPAGTNNIGDVDIASALPAGSNTIGSVTALSGATDDAAAAGQIYTLAGLYQATVDEVDAGDVGRLRMTARRGVITAPDYKYLDLYAAAPNPTGNDVSVLGVAPVASDFEIRSATTSYFYIPMTIAGWKHTYLNVQNTLDQAITVQILSAFDGLYGPAVSRLAQFIIPAGGAGVASSSGAVGVGGEAGAGTAGTQSYYSVPAMYAVPMIVLAVAVGTPPTTGGLSVRIGRSS